MVQVQASGDARSPSLGSLRGAPRNGLPRRLQVRLFDGSIDVRQPAPRPIHRSRAAVHLWVDQSRRFCAWAQAYYQQKKQKGMTHAAALRCLAQRWLKILWRMWQDGACYDEAFHARNQVAHGSWVIALMPESDDKSSPRQG